MTVNKDELRELIESDFFGDGAFSLDDLVASEEKIPKDPSHEKFLESDLFIERFDEHLLGNEFATLSGSPVTRIMPADDIIAQEEQSLEAFFDDAKQRFDAVEQEIFNEDSSESFEPPLAEEPVPFSPPIINEPIEHAISEEEKPPVAPVPVDEVQQRINVRPIEFPELEGRISGQPFDLGFFSNIPVKIDVFLGDTTMSLKDVYDLTEGAIIPLDKRFGEPLEIRINGQTIAKGDVVAVDQHYGIMIKEIIRHKS